MKSFVLASALCALALSVSAQPVTDGNAVDNTVTIKPNGPLIMLPAHAQVMSRSEFARFTGSYELADGSSVALFTRGLKKYAALHGEAWHEVVAVSGNSFVAKDRQLKVTLEQGDNGEVTGGDVLFVTSTLERVAKAGKRKAHMERVQTVQSVAML